MKKYIFLAMLCIACTCRSQENSMLQDYRNKVREYSRDIKMAEKTSAIKSEMVKSAYADFLPTLSGSANAGYTGNPMRISKRIDGIDAPINIEGNDTKYGASLTIEQPIYTGGATSAKYKKAKKETELSDSETERIMNNITYNADVYYWNKVACGEMVIIAEKYRNSAAQLVSAVRTRVDAGYADPNDLLMAEVKLNDAEYRLAKACTEAETARLAMNSFSGIPSEDTIATDSIVAPLKLMPETAASMEEAMKRRPEMKSAEYGIEIQRQEAKIASAQFRPQLTVGIDGSFSSPGYDFRPDMDSNYTIYATVHMPIFVGGKRSTTKAVGKYNIAKAEDFRQKTEDDIRLEIETCTYNCSEAVKKVILTESSLEKAEASEWLAMERYDEGNISIVEAINAQIYRMEAEINHVQAKLDAQIAKSRMYKAIGTINN